MSSFDVQAFVQEQIALAAKSTPIPGWTLVEIAEGTKGADTVGVGIIDMTDVRLQDPALRARCNAWFLALRRVGGKKGLKEICKQANLLIGGSVRVLTMRLAFSGKSPPRASASAPAASSSSSSALLAGGGAAADVVVVVSVVASDVDWTEAVFFDPADVVHNCAAGRGKS